MSHCDKCGKNVDRLYGMTNGEFYCRKCANIKSNCDTGIDDPRPWKVEVFSYDMTTKDGSVVFKSLVNKFLAEHIDCKIETTSCAAGTKFFLTVMYKEKNL